MIESLSKLKKGQDVIRLGSLPDEVHMSGYAYRKAFLINQIIRKVHGKSLEWYGYMLARQDEPELVVDIGLGRNATNMNAYTNIDPDEIGKFQESLPLDTIINGWIHSHADLGLRRFSGTDERNHLTVASYVSTILEIPLEKREVMVDDLTTLVKGAEQDMSKGSITLVTDRPVAEARLYELRKGSFSYAVVIGDEGWTEQEIHFTKEDMLTGNMIRDKQSDYGKVGLDIVPPERYFDTQQVRCLVQEVMDKTNVGLVRRFTSRLRGAYNGYKVR